MKIKNFLEQHKDEWLVIKVTKKNKSGVPEEGELLYHTPDREKAWKHVPSTKGYIQVIYAGDPIKKGYAAVFLNGI